MMYLLDTNILLGILRNNHVKLHTASILGLTDINDLFIAVVTVGEVWSIARQNGWGENRINQLNQILNEFAIADINDDDVIQRYADIDALVRTDWLVVQLGHQPEIWVKTICG